MPGTRKKNQSKAAPRNRHVNSDRTTERPAETAASIAVCQTTGQPADHAAGSCVHVWARMQISQIGGASEATRTSAARVPRMIRMGAPSCTRKKLVPPRYMLDQRTVCLLQTATLRTHATIKGMLFRRAEGVFKFVSNWTQICAGKTRTWRSAGTVKLFTANTKTRTAAAASERRSIGQRRHRIRRNPRKAGSASR